MEKTKIDWCDSTWNPVTGCLHGCKYCYARGISNRFSGGGEKWCEDKLIVLEEKVYAEESEKAEPYPYGFVPTFHKYRLDEYAAKKKRNIFVCSMADLFGKWVPTDWKIEVLEACRKAPQHNYLFLTKDPIGYVGVIVPTESSYRNNWQCLKSIKNAKRRDREKPLTEMLFLMFRSAARDRYKLSQAISAGEEKDAATGMVVAKEGDE